MTSSKKSQQGARFVPRDDNPHERALHGYLVSHGGVSRLMLQVVETYYLPLALGHIGGYSVQDIELAGIRSIENLICQANIIHRYLQSIGIAVPPDARLNKGFESDRLLGIPKTTVSTKDEDDDDDDWDTPTNHRTSNDVDLSE
jgi:hypothetical protein